MITAAATSYTRLVKVCGYCEQEIGRQRLEPGEEASHGTCKRHLIEFLRPIASPSYLEALELRSEDTFCPDLAKRPDLVGTTNELTTTDERGGIHS